ncbi:protein kinase domain-containing protein [Streptomyces sp. NPDC055134]
MPSPLTHDDPVAFGAYRLIARLGSGGMGAVYLARSAGGRTVAVKTMHARIASDHAFRTRFRLETDAARVIGGQFGAAVVDADPLAGTPWLATEYVLGPPLDEAVELAGPLPEASVRVLGAALCTALGQLHRSDVVHRDLKPSNIMVTAYGPKVIDFGIARAIGDDRLTSTGAAVGTPAFMSPEQATGQEHTSAGDVFALAGVLAFAATGQGPFGHGQPADLLYRVRYGDPDLTNVPPALAEILGRCLAKDPAQRPTTERLAAELHDGAGEFADQLPAQLLAEIGRRSAEVWQIAPRRLGPPMGEPPAVGPTEPSDVKRLTSRRSLFKIGGVALGAVAAGAGTWAWQARNDEPKTHSKQPSGPAAKDGDQAEKKLDSLWQRQVEGPMLELVPVAPIAAGTMVALVAGPGLNCFDAKSGAKKWASERSEDHWQVVSDGERLHRIVEAKGARTNRGRAQGWPLVVETVDLSSGAAIEPTVQNAQFNGVIYENQLICVADDVMYVVAGRGPFAIGPFVSAQSWFVSAVSLASGKSLWSTPLPDRPKGSDRLYVLAARVVGGRLITLQETNSGAAHAVARDVRTGDIIWDRALDGVNPDRLRVPLATDDKNLYVGAGRLKALRLSDGNEVWDSKAQDLGGWYGPPTVKDGVVHAVERAHGLAAFGATSGKSQWAENWDGTSTDIVNPPIVGHDLIYTKRGSDLRAVDLSSREIMHTYRTTGDRFIVHERSKVILSLGEHFLAAFPLR